MRTIAHVISWLSLAGVIIPAFAYLAGRTTLDASKTWMLVFTITWFVTVPLWMDRRKSD